MWWRELEPKAAMRGCGFINGPVCSVATQQCIWDVAFKKICAVWPFPPLPRLISPASLRIYIHLPAKGRTILAFHFPVQGFSVFADKCSPIHPDRCHIASLLLWYIASDPATCNRESAPGTPLPGPHSDMGDYFKGASLAALCVETQATRCVHKHSEMWVSARVWVRQRQCRSTCHRSPWHGAISLAGIYVALRSNSCPSFSSSLWLHRSEQQKQSV